MDTAELEPVLDAILQGLLLVDNSENDSRSSLLVLSKVISNAIQGTDPKFRRLPAANEKIQQKIINVSGASEFLDAIGFVRENEGRGDFVLSDTTRLKAAATAVEKAIALLPPQTGQQQQQQHIQKPASASSQSPHHNKGTDEYEKRRQEAEARQAEIAKKMEEDRKKKEALRSQIKADQKEARERPVVASHAVKMVRAEQASAGGNGKIEYKNTDREFQAVISSKSPVLVNFTASWCGPCQSIAPAVEEMARSNPSVTFIKIDIDENNETPSKYNVSAVPTFILFKNGSVVGEVKGANVQGIQTLLSKA